MGNNSKNKDQKVDFKVSQPAKELVETEENILNAIWDEFLMSGYSLTSTDRIRILQKVSQVDIPLMIAAINAAGDSALFEVVASVFSKHLTDKQKDKLDWLIGYHEAETGEIYGNEPDLFDDLDGDTGGV